MSNLKVVFSLSIISAMLFLLTSNYNEWVTNNELTNGDFECKPIQLQILGQTILNTENKSISVGLDCGASVPFWFNSIWIVPLIGIAAYALVPFVK
jgi:hypothetical protein